jgi:C-terminal processing protease CtpA/Prc
MIRRTNARARLFAWCWMALALLPAALPAQDLRAIDRERGRTMLRQVHAQIRERYYDPRYHGVDLDARVAALDSVIQGATTLGEVFGAVAQLTLDLGDSHTFFVPPRQTVQVDYGWEMLIVGDSAYVSRVDRGSDAQAQGVRPGDRVISVNGYLPSRRNIWQILYLFSLLRPQPGLRVVMQAPGAQPRQMDLAAAVRQRARIVDLTEAGEDIYALIREAQNDEREDRSRMVEVGADVLVWKLPTFAVEDRVIREGLRRARGRRALVLDLRGNGGGPVHTLTMLLDGLSGEALRIGTWHERGRQTALWTNGSDDAFAGELIVLVDSESASAAEITARVAQLAGRGVVLGDRTAGAVMRSRFETLSAGAERVVMYGVSVTEADLVMSDGGRLEGTGVMPDEVILPGATEMAAGEDPVLAVALERLGVSMDPAAAAALLRER